MRIRKRKELQLNEFEIFDTRDSLQEMALNCGVAVLSLAVVILGGSKYAGLAGFVYMLIGVAMGVNGKIMESAGAGWRNSLRRWRSRRSKRKRMSPSSLANFVGTPISVKIRPSKY